MIVISGMKMPKSCRECPFLYAGIDNACCIARARYEATQDGEWGIHAPSVFEECTPEDSFCPLYDDTAIDAALEEIKRLRGEVARLTGEHSGKR